jgi:carbon-monoxide dehydrogenase medium subunit
MFPAQFDYFTPTSLDEALSLLAEHGDDAKVLAGGQSLIPLMKLRFATPPVVIDVNRIPGIDALDEDEGSLCIGALVRNRTLERSDLVSTRYPTIAAATPLISDPVVRNRGTLVGSLCHADPQGDYGSVMLALDGEILVRSTNGERRISMTELLDGPFVTTLRPDELAIEARVPVPGDSFSGTYLKLERKVGDFATVGVAIFLSSTAGVVERAGIGLTGVGPTNIKAVDAERVLVGERLSDAAIDEAARLAADASEPRTDLRGSAEYKREVVRVYVARGLHECTLAAVA